MGQVAKSFRLYTQPNCKWCVLAKDLLDTIGWFYVVVDISQDAQARELLRDLKLKTVPQVWFGDDHIGGFSNLEEWWQRRKGDLNG